MEEDNADDERNGRLKLDALPHLEDLSQNATGCNL
jgi:hypothetical protein